MRVALLSYNAQAQDAVGNQLAEKAAFFLERGAEVRVFVQAADRLHPELRGHAQELRRAEPSGAAWEYLATADLVIAIYSQYYELLQLLPLLAGGKPRILLHYHGVTPPELWHTPRNEALEQGLHQRGFIWCADQALADSAFTRQELIAATDFPDPRVTHLPLPVDCSRFRPEPGCRFLHERLKLDPAARVLLYVGRLAGNKRVPLLIEALARLRDDVPAVHLAAIGDDRDVYRIEADRCLALAAELGVSPRVHLLGRLEDAQLARAYQSASLLVLPSLHEGFCLPVIEAMASGLPVVAARATALPETVGAAGLTFTPNDVDDLVRQVRRVWDTAAPAQPRRTGRVAVVCFRFGPDIVGGAETSLRTLAQALQSAGQHVEVFTTCTRSESRWRNELPAGTVTLDGLTVHRFPIDAHDREQHCKVVVQVLQADGRVAADVEGRYLEHSLHSRQLVDTLVQRRAEFDAVVVGPYLFGLTHDVARALPAQTLVVPCFHDEALARLRVWADVYGQVGGILYHSPEEQQYAQNQLGINHPNARELGTWIDMDAAAPARGPERPYLVYCGRYSEQKRVPELLEWAERYQEDRPGRFDFVFLGQGDVTLPRAPWLRDLGRLDEASKRGVLAGARALVQLSRQESLSLVALEAWAQGTPVLVHRGCRVLESQVRRAQGGVALDDYDSFAAALDDIWQNAAAWKSRGQNGRSYVTARYGSRQDYVNRALDAIAQLSVPLAEQMRRRGVERAAECDREVWRAGFGRLVDDLLEKPGRPYREDIGIQPYQSDCRVGWGTRSALLPLRVFNWGSHAAASEGPGRTVVYHEITELRTGHVVVPRQTAELGALLAPGRAQTAVVSLTIPAQPGQYRIALWAGRERLGGRVPEFRVHLPLTVEARGTVDAPSCAGTLLEDLQRTLPEVKRLQKLPDDYDDVSDGHLGGVKRYVKWKLLNNFKQGYVDILSHQQSQVNAQLIVAVQQLGECCAVLDKAVRGLQQRLDQMETKIEQLVGDAESPGGSPAEAERQRVCAR
jgi:glycosyltransferase involved in cell wall biosynthesis